jgi:hypothetical protein
MPSGPQANSDLAGNPNATITSIVLHITTGKGERDSSRSLKEEAIENLDEIT